MGGAIRFTLGGSVVGTVLRPSRPLVETNAEVMASQRVCVHTSNVYTFTPPIRQCISLVVRSHCETLYGAHHERRSHNVTTLQSAGMLLCCLPLPPSPCHITVRTHCPNTAYQSLLPAAEYFTYKPCNSCICCMYLFSLDCSL